MNTRTLKRLFSLMLSIMMLSSLVGAFAEGQVEYIAAPHTIPEGGKIDDAYLEPVFYENADGPTIGVTMVGVLKIGDQYFKDSNNNQQLDPFEDWRLPTDQRVADLVQQMTLAQQAGFAHNIQTANPIAQKTEDLYDAEGKLSFEKIFPVKELHDTGGGQNFVQPFSADTILERKAYSSILRSSPTPTVLALFNNALSQVTEYGAVLNGEPAIPYTMISNPTNQSRNANLETSANAHKTFGTYPSTLAMTAAVMGDVANGGDYSMIRNYADNSRKEWNAVGIDAMYGPQIDLPTDPRWSRNNGTYGEDPQVAAEITRELLMGYQQGDQGEKDGGVAIIMKHFPGDGAAENGFESHYFIGEWRLYPTPGSLEKYQLVPFQAAVDAKVAAFMPGYSRPAKDGRSAKQTVKGVELEVEEVANAYNKDILTTLLYDIMGFTGYINSDTGYISTKQFGMVDATIPERYAKAISAGIDVTGDEFRPEAIVEAVETGLLPREDLNRASSRRLTSIFNMGRFENPYRSPEEAEAVSAQTTVDPAIYEAHQKAVVLMKNTDKALPLKEGAKVYVEYFNATGITAVETQKVKDVFAAKGFTVVDDVNEAEYAYLMVVPTMNNRDHMTVLNLVDGLEVAQRSYPESQALSGKTINATTVVGMGKVKAIADAVHKNGGKVISAINISSPWILSNLEPYSDGLVGIFGSWLDAQVDVLSGKYQPTGKLPITMVSSSDVIAVEWQEIDGVMREICVSPNDVPGYDKDQYIAKEILEKVPGGSYAYYDANGNYYKVGFGLSYE